MRISTAALLLIVAAAGPGAAQQLPQRPADSGKAMVFEAPARSIDQKPGPGFCPVALPCRLELLGKIERNGAVELKATAFSW